MVVKQQPQIPRKAAPAAQGGDGEGAGRLVPGANVWVTRRRRGGAGAGDSEQVRACVSLCVCVLWYSVFCLLAIMAFLFQSSTRALFAGFFSRNPIAWAALTCVMACAAHMFKCGVPVVLRQTTARQFFSSNEIEVDLTHTAPVSGCHFLAGGGRREQMEGCCQRGAPLPVVRRRRRRWDQQQQQQHGEVLCLFPVVSVFAPHRARSSKQHRSLRGRMKCSVGFV